MIDYYLETDTMPQLDTYPYRDDLAMLTDGEGGHLYYDPAGAVDLAEAR